MKKKEPINDDGVPLDNAASIIQHTTPSSPTPYSDLMNNLAKSFKGLNESMQKTVQGMSLGIGSTRIVPENRTEITRHRFGFLGLTLFVLYQATAYKNNTATRTAKGLTEKSARRRVQRQHAIRNLQTIIYVVTGSMALRDGLELAQLKPGWPFLIFNLLGYLVLALCIYYVGLTQSKNIAHTGKDPR